MIEKESFKMIESCFTFLGGKVLVQLEAELFFLREANVWAL